MQVVNANLHAHQIILATLQIESVKYATLIVLNAQDQQTHSASRVNQLPTKFQQIIAIHNAQMELIQTQIMSVRTVTPIVKHVLGLLKLIVQHVNLQLMLEEWIGAQIDAAHNTMQMEIKFVISAINIVINALVLQIVNVQAGVRLAAIK